MPSSGSKRVCGNVDGREGSAAKRAISAATNRTPTTMKRAAVGVKRGAVIGRVMVGAAAAVEGAALSAIGFTALGPAAGSAAATWMSRIALANGGGVASGSIYAALQSAAMGGAGLFRMPVVIAAVATRAAVGGIDLVALGGAAPGAPDDSASPELMSSEDEVPSEQVQSIVDDPDDELFRH